MGNASLQNSRERKGYYVRGSRKLVAVIFVLALINLGLFMSAGYLVVSQDESTDYYAITCDSDPVRLDPLSSAVVTADQLLRWANVAAISAYNYNFVNWRQRMGELRPYFSKSGWDGFYSSFKSSQVDPMVAKKTMVSAVALGVPVIEQRGVLNGRYTWRVAIPLLVTYQSSSDKSQERLLVRMLIGRVPAVLTPRGIAISQFHTSGLGGAR
jgi:intracellular multiplication protein IcmL